MATYYLDYEGGSDAADGLSFANRWKTFTSGATAARIAPGDTIRVMGSPAATSLGINGTWTANNNIGTASITSSTNATPIVITSAAHGLITGNTVVIVNHTTNTFANGTWEVTRIDDNTFSLDTSVGNGVGGATGTFQRVNHKRVKLASALTKTIANCDLPGGAWTASANVTATVITSDFKEGYGAASIVIAGAFTTGLAAYFPLGSITDFSAYKQISFFIKQTSGTTGADGAITLSLCSDTVGAVPVNTINVPTTTTNNKWIPMTVDTAGALGASIQSVALNVVTDNGAQTFLLDNIIACKDSTSADAIHLRNLIGKNTGTETWFAIQSITDSRVMLDQGYQILPSAGVTYRGYAGTTETVTAYRRETIRTTMVTAASTAVNQITDSGTLGSLISYEGGWNRTDMSTQTLDTWYDGQNGFGRGFDLTSRSYVSMNKINAVRYSEGFFLSACSQINLNNWASNNNTVSALTFVGCYGVDLGTCNGLSHNVVTTAAMNFTGNNSDIYATNIYSCDGNSARGIQFGSGSAAAARINLGIVVARNNGTNNLCLQGTTTCIMQSLTSTTGGSSGILSLATSNTIINNLVSQGNTTSGINNTGGDLALTNAAISEATEVTTTTGYDAYVFSGTHDATTDNHQIFTDGGRISSTSAVRHTASGIAWQFAPTSATRTALYPLRLSIANIMCNANALVTVKAWFRRDNTGITARLVCKGGQIAGVPTDAVATASAVIDTWEELTITFTPTVIGGVEIIAEAYGGTTFNAYVDDETLTQA